MNNIKIPIGKENFSEVIRNGYYYVDKTKMIEEIVNSGFEVYLFTRPRRFGKSLNISMLESFFDIKDGDRNKDLFKGLYIETSKCFKEQGKYPVLSISFKGLEGETYDQMLINLQGYITELYRDNQYLEEKLDPYRLKDFKLICNGEYRDGLLEQSLSLFVTCLNIYWNEQIVVLIDEYDDPIISAKEKNYYTEAITFFKNLYGTVLKGNPLVKTGILTGIIRVAQAGIFSDLNNFKVYTILKTEYDEYFGFTEDEVIEALDTFGLSKNLPQVKQWYDGYKFGDTEIYNPWSILNYLDEKEFQPYWVNTSSNSLITELLRKSSQDTIGKLHDLIEGGSTIVTLRKEVSINNKLNQSKLWEFFLFLGYLKVVNKFGPNLYELTIPNHEVKTMFETAFVDISFGDESPIDSLNAALLKQDITAIEYTITEIIMRALSYWSLDTKVYREKTYQLTLAGFMYGLENSYIMHTEIETGKGRSDILLEPRHSDTAYIFELKMKGNSQDPIQQIESKQDRKSVV